MCTVPGKNGTFRDSALKGLQRLQEKHQHTHSYTLFLQDSYIHTAIKHFKLCTVIQLHVALVVYS